MGQDELLCVDPDADRRSATLLAIAEAVHDADVVAVGTPREALDRLSGSTIGVVTTDRFPDADLTGVELLARARERRRDAACVLLADASDDPGVDAIDGGGVEVVAPDADEVELRARLFDAMSAAHGGHFPEPPDEEARLSDLRTYPLSYEPLQDALDRLVALVEGYFGTLFANVHVIGRSEQFSVACRGPTPLDADRADSVCTYAILSEEVTVVEDLSVDERFRDKEYVSEYDLVGYAGAPIRTPAGHTLGTVCILDDEPIDLGDDDALALQRFADEVADQFVLNRERYRRESGTSGVIDGD